MGGCFKDILFGFAASLGVEEKGLGGYCDRDGAIDFFKEVVDYRC